MVISAVLSIFEDQMKKRPDIKDYLLWEYDIPTFNWKKSYKIVIERVIQLGDLHGWRAMISFYSHEQILATAEWSKQLDKRDKIFTKLFLKSDFLDAA